MGLRTKENIWEHIQQRLPTQPLNKDKYRHV